MLYYTRKAASNRHTHLLGPTNVNVLSTSSNQTFTFDSDQVFVITAGSTINLNPSGTFPPGHQVFVSVPSGSTVTFDSSGANVGIAAGSAVMFVYDGTNWKTVLYSSTIATTSSGTSGLVQLSDGSGGVTSDTALSFNTSTNVLTVDGKLTVTGLIDPTGLVVDEKANTAATGHSSAAGKALYWVKSDTPNRPMFTNDAGTEKKILINGDNVSELTNDAGYVDASGAASAAPATNLGYTASSRTVTSSTGTDAVITEVVAGGNSGLITGADKTKLDGIATSATNTEPPAIKDNSGTPAFVSGITKAEVQTLLNIEDGADVTDTTNVTAAGALMDSEVTNLALVKGLTAGISNGNVLVANANVADDDFLRIDGTSVEGLTAAEVRTALNIADGSTANAGTVTSIAVSGSDGIEIDSGSPITTSGTIALGVNKTNMLAHLNVEDGADVTDASNVNAAGAVMHTDLGTKGDLVVGDGVGTNATILGVGTNGHVLTADSSEASGVKWAATEASLTFGVWQSLTDYDNKAEATDHLFPADDSDTTNWSKSGTLTGFSSGVFTATASTAGTYIVRVQYQYGAASTSPVSETSGNKYTLQLLGYKNSSTLVGFGRVQINGFWADSHFYSNYIVTLADGDTLENKYKLVDHSASGTKFKLKSGGTNDDPTTLVEMVKIA